MDDLGGRPWGGGWVEIILATPEARRRAPITAQMSEGLFCVQA